MYVDSHVQIYVRPHVCQETCAGLRGGAPGRARRVGQSAGRVSQRAAAPPGPLTGGAIRGGPQRDKSVHHHAANTGQRSSTAARPTSRRIEMSVLAFPYSGSSARIRLEGLVFSPLLIFSGPLASSIMRMRCSIVFSLRRSCPPPLEAPAGVSEVRTIIGMR